MTRPSAVIFDLGGVVLDSPIHVIEDYEREHGITVGAINRAVFSEGDHGVWARHERGEMTRMAFLDEFATALAGHGLDVDTEELMARIESSFRTRPEMLSAIGRLRREGLLVAAITNNWTPFAPHGLSRHFDVFLESVLEGVRKPEPAIYHRCLQRLGVDGSRTVMLDDLGPNLKPARDIGMRTIKVVTSEQALSELGAILGLDLI